MASKVRVRFAPSPTGPLHIGGVRTALFNYLFAKKHRGDFILRIEDTDQTRYVEGAEAYIIESLHWLNIPFDEGPGKNGGFGPYRQSERKGLYKEYAETLIAKEKAYYAFDTPEELDAIRKEYESEGQTFIYNWHNRESLKNSLTISPEEVASLIESGAPYVVRFKMVDSGKGTSNKLAAHDIVRGDLEFDLNLLDDKVLYKSDGMPTYHLANIVDDRLMEISHVIRGEEWLPSLPLHLKLYEALDWEAPNFAHLPLIMKPVGKGKLSKRDGEAGGFPVYPLEWKTAKETYMGYREEGYFPEAVVNMLALLGWNPGTEQELFDLQGLVDAFDLSRVNKAGAKFDPEKTKWFQHCYLQQMKEEDLVEDFITYLEEQGITPIGKEAIVVHMMKERATFVSDIWEQGSFFYIAPSDYEEKAAKKAFKEDTAELLLQVKTLIESLEDFSSESLSNTVKGWITGHEIGFGRVMMPLRLSLVGEMKGPDVFDIVHVLGKKESIRRIDKAIQVLS